MSLAAQKSKVLFSKAPIQEQVIAVQNYSADQPGTDLESELEAVEIQYWNTGTLSSSTRLWELFPLFFASSPNPLIFLALDQLIGAPF